MAKRKRTGELARLGLARRTIEKPKEEYPGKDVLDPATYDAPRDAEQIVDSTRGITMGRKPTWRRVDDADAITTPTRGTFVTEHERLSRREALGILESAGGHAWLTVLAGRKIAAAFGLAIEPDREATNTGEPKGLKVPGAAPGTVIEGYSCVLLAERIADHVADASDELERARTGQRNHGPVFGGLRRPYLAQSGRGARCRSACEVIAAVLDLFDRNGDDTSAVADANAPEPAPPGGTLREPRAAIARGSRAEPGTGKTGR